MSFTILKTRMWANVKGQLSWIKHSLAPESEFSFAKNLGKQVELDNLKSPPEEGMPDVQIREVSVTDNQVEPVSQYYIFYAYI